MPKSLPTAPPSVYTQEIVSAIGLASGCDLSDKRINGILTRGLDAAAMWFGLSLTGGDLAPSVDNIEQLKRISKIAGKVAVSGALLDLQMRGPETAHIQYPRHLTRNYLGQRASLATLFMVNDDVEVFLSGRQSTAMVQSRNGGQDRLERILMRLIDPTAKPAVVCVAAIDLSSLASRGADRLERVRATTTRPRHSGDVAMNGWIDDMLNLYQHVAGRKAATSTISQGWANEGVASGPLIRFLMAAFGPISEILQANGQPVPALFEDAWASRVRTAREAKARSKPSQIVATSGPK